MTSIVQILDAHPSIIGQAIRRCHLMPHIPFDDEMINAVVDALHKRGWSGADAGDNWTHPHHPGKHTWGEAFGIEYPP